eukprot:s1193_g6.t1
MAQWLEHVPFATSNKVVSAKRVVKAQKDYLCMIEEARGVSELYIQVNGEVVRLRPELKSAWKANNDFAVTGPQRTDSFSQAMHKPVSAAAAYADLKATHQDTGRLCSEQGIDFQPTVVETTGAWDKTASHVLHIVAAAVAARERATVADLHNRLLQELSITTRRFRAQAALRRRAEIITQTQPTARASAVLLEG